MCKDRMCIVMMDDELVCPNCGSDNYWRKGYTAEGKQRHQCKDCGRDFIDPKNHDKPKRTGHNCPHCESEETIWHGWALLTGGRRRRRIKCKGCKRTFYPPKTDKETPDDE